ncbi:trypsin-like serine peptidase [Streptomyces sp. NPDC056519]|uniref:trypsin-like serine peptidase n=1 Tax=Streptomyces sp. NPDC056519 TaxID=3345849 RepID=UPI0036CD01CF
MKDGADKLPGQDRTKPDDGAVWGDGPVKSIGRLFMTTFMTDPWGNKLSVARSCTGTVVSDPNSPSEKTVVTANHCVVSHPYNKDGQSGRPDWSRPEWNTNLYFVPGYRDGAKPQGGFTVNTTLATRSYTDSGNSAEDVAMLSLNPAGDGRQIGQIAGTQKIAFDAPRTDGQFTYAFGYTSDYSGAPWLTGQLLGYCAGPASKNTDQPELNHWGITCTMGKGSSGGPHLVGFDAATATGTVVGVNSEGRGGDAGVPALDAASLGTTGKQMYEQAQQPAQ